MFKLGTQGGSTLLFSSNILVVLCRQRTQCYPVHAVSPLPCAVWLVQIQSQPWRLLLNGRDCCSLRPLTHGSAAVCRLSLCACTSGCWVDTGRRRSPSSRCTHRCTAPLLSGDTRYLVHGQTRAHPKVYDTLRPLGGSNTHRLNTGSAGGTSLCHSRYVSGMERRTVKSRGARAVGVIRAPPPATLNALLRQGKQPVLRAQHYKTLEKNITHTHTHTHAQAWTCT